ncbi:hypothetical protein HELRODRAFT_81819 [Helobdella robusta]|uniref:Hemerythrin-like domain-containing protein n=1 Tax=Helobdella robusta TaxID=6412 RepID=T1G4J1_HELRO|nr:hypothetical protein HELRODRAFT_81819 [Helobdella robusta]ESO01275.1 hypothetical protein HELRODRAFT_81819 [Helobdella robusta]
MKILVVLAACLAVCLAFDIPRPFKWDESFKVFYEKIDEQHQGLFEAIYQVCRHPEDAEKLKHLDDVIEKHFRDEEKMMEDAKYEEYDEHHKIHADFEAKLDAVHVPVTRDQVKYAKEWLVNHIKGIDFKYKGKL